MPSVFPPMRLGLRGHQAKVMSSVLSGSAVRLLRWSQARACSSPRTTDLAVALEVVEVAYMALSSTYNVRSLWIQEAVRVSRGEVYSAERIGERGDPWGVPYVMPNSGDVYVPICRDAVRSMRKESTQRHTLSGKPFKARTHMAHSGLR